MARDNYQHITDTLIDLLEQVDPADWTRPWAGGAPRPTNAHTQNAYNGANVMMLWLAAQVGGYASNEWVTYRQAQKMGGHVKKGESGTPICFFRIVTRELEDDEKAETGDDKETFPVLKTWTVFNREQCEGLPPVDDDFEPLPESERRETVDAFIAHTGAQVEHGGTRACYAPDEDVIRLPEWERFESGTAYYTTALHELAHWTGHTDRLARLETFGRFGDEAYAAEELVAEMAAAYVASDLRVPVDFDKPAQYLAGWLQVLREDKYAIFTAAREAENAAEFLHELQPEADDVAPEDQDQAA